MNGVQSSFMCLPEDMQVEILTHVDLTDVRSMQEVSSSLRDVVTNQDRIWETVSKKFGWELCSKQGEMRAALRKHVDEIWHRAQEVVARTRKITVRGDRMRQVAFRLPSVVLDIKEELQKPQTVTSAQKIEYLLAKHTIEEQMRYHTDRLPWLRTPDFVQEMLKEAASIENTKKLMTWLTIRPKLLLWHQIIQQLGGQFHSFLDGICTLEEAISKVEELELCVDKLDCVNSIDFTRAQLDTLPREIGRLTQLKKLELGENLFRKMPESIFSLTNLQELGFSGNYLESVPSAFSLTFDKLRILNLANNRLTSFPQNQGKLSNELVIDLNGNSELTVPAWVVNG